MKNRPMQIVLPVLLVLAGAGCDSTPETRPMDEPLDTGSAIEADDRMQKSAQSLLEENGGGNRND